MNYPGQFVCQHTPTHTHTNTRSVYLLLLHVLKSLSMRIVFQSQYFIIIATAATVTIGSLLITFFLCKTRPFYIHVYLFSPYLYICQYLIIPVLFLPLYLSPFHSFHTRLSGFSIIHSFNCYTTFYRSMFFLIKPF